MRKTLLLIATATAIFPAHAYATAHVLTMDDAKAINKFDAEFNSLGNDIIESAQTVNHINENNQDQTQCLIDVSNELREIRAIIGTESDLINISVMMQDPVDEAIVNATLKRNAPFTLALIGASRKGALQEASICSSSALVNTYAQKAAALADRAANGVRYVQNKVTTAAQNSTK